MIELALIAQLVYPYEMSNPAVVQCAAEVGVDPRSRNFTYQEFQDFLDCRERTTGSRYRG